MMWTSHCLQQRLGAGMLGGIVGYAHIGDPDHGGHPFRFGIEFAAVGHNT